MSGMLAGVDERQIKRRSPILVADERLGARLGSPTSTAICWCCWTSCSATWSCGCRSEAPRRVPGWSTA